MSTEHELKILPEYYTAVCDGQKNFEIRKDDRNFRVGDWLKLREWNGTSYTGGAVLRRITYILRDVPGLEPGYVILGIE